MVSNRITCWVLWEGPLRTLAHPRASPERAEPDEDQPQELPLVLDPEFL